MFNVQPLYLSVTYLSLAASMTSVRRTEIFLAAVGPPAVTVAAPSSHWQRQSRFVLQGRYLAIARAAIMLHVAVPSGLTAPQDLASTLQIL